MNTDSIVLLCSWEGDTSSITDTLSIDTLHDFDEQTYFIFALVWRDLHIAPMRTFNHSPCHVSAACHRQQVDRIPVFYTSSDWLYMVQDLHDEIRNAWQSALIFVVIHVREKLSLDIIRWNVL